MGKPLTAWQRNTAMLREEKEKKKRKKAIHWEPGEKAAIALELGNALKYASDSVPPVDRAALRAVYDAEVELVEKMVHIDAAYRAADAANARYKAAVKAAVKERTALVAKIARDNKLSGKAIPDGQLTPFRRQQLLAREYKLENEVREAQMKQMRVGGRFDKTGMTFGNLTVIGTSDTAPYGATTFWECRCICGKTIRLMSTKLNSGGQCPQSCGCSFRDGIPGSWLSRVRAAASARDKIEGGTYNMDTLARVIDEAGGMPTTTKEQDAIIRALQQEDFKSSETGDFK